MFLVQMECFCIHGATYQPFSALIHAKVLLYYQLIV